MFLTASGGHTIEDFFQAVNFIAPKNADIKYFIVPYADKDFNTVAKQAGFTAENNTEPNTQDVSGVTTPITYTKKAIKDIHSFTSNHFDANQRPAPMPKEPSTPELLTQDIMVSGGMIDSPEKLKRAVSIVENTSKTIDIQLKESVDCFPENTIFHFTKSGING